MEIIAFPATCAYRAIMRRNGLNLLQILGAGPKQ